MKSKFFITEDEKKHIKKLYAVESVSSPDDFVVVEKKNPFKYNEYQSARRFYSRDLKIDDLFFVFDEKLLKDYIEEKFIENFDKKTIRYNIKGYPKEDEIGTFDLKYLMLVVLIDQKGNPGTQCIDYVRLTLSDLLYGIIFEPSIGFAYLSRYEIKGKNTTVPNVYEEIEVESNDTIKNKVSSFSNWNTIPDEFFEIRKVQKKQTDF